MTTQPEQILEDNLVAQLTGMDYEPLSVTAPRPPPVSSTKFLTLSSPSAMAHSD